MTRWVHQMSGGLSRGVWIATALLVSACHEAGPSAPSDAGHGVDAGRVGDAGSPVDGGHIVTLDGGEMVVCLQDWAGDRQEGTTQADEALAVRIDARGRVFVAGYERGIVGQTNIEPSGNADGFVARYSPVGTLDWRAPIRTTGTDIVEHLVERADGTGVTVVGRTSAVVQGTNQGSFDAFIAELNADGLITQLLQVGDERPQHLVQIATGADRLFVAGYDDLFVEHSQLIDDENGTIARIDHGPEGALSKAWWSRSDSAMNPDRVTGLAVLPDGSALFLSGFKFFDDAESLGGAFLRRLDADGNEGWRTQIAMTATEAQRVLLLPNGDVMVVGSTQLKLGEAVVGQADPYVATFDPADGTLKSAHQYGTIENDFVTAATLAPSGDIYLAGDTLGAFGNAQNQGERDLFVLRLDPSGTLVGQWQGGSPARDHLSDIAVDSCGFVVLTGFTEGDLIPLAHNAGSRDWFLRRLQPTDLTLPSPR